MKPFNRTLSLSIDALHVRIDYVKAVSKTDPSLQDKYRASAAKRRLKQLRGQLRKLERKIRA